VRVPHRRLLSLLAWGLTFSLTGGRTFAAEALIPVAKPDRTTPVDFYREVVPVLQANCLPCHNKTTTKADLLLETPADMLKGGESGPSIVPGKSAESLLLKVATHEEKPRMPPKENKVNAVNLKPEELGLLALWIDQGAKAAEKREEAIAWQPLSEAVNPILAVAVTEDGRYAACGRGNRIYVYQLPSGQFLGRLADAALSTNGDAAAAHRDVVNSLAFSPDGNRIASGGFRELKLWRRTFASSPETLTNGSPIQPSPSTQLSADGKFRLTLTNGLALLSDAGTKQFVAALATDAAAEAAIGQVDRSLVRLRAERDLHQASLEAARKERDAQRERVHKADEALAAAAKALSAKEPAWETAKQNRLAAELDQARVFRSSAGATNAVDLRKKAAEKVEAANKAVEPAEQELKPLRQKLESARNEAELASTGVLRAETALLAAEYHRRKADLEITAAETELHEAAGRAVHAVAPVLAAAFSPDSRRVATSHEDGTVRLWDSADASPVEVIPAGVRATAIAFADEHTLRLRSASGAGQRLALQPAWVLERTLGGVTNSAFADRVTALAFRPDGTRLAVGGGEPTRGGDLQIWDPVAGRLLYAVGSLHSDTVLALAYSPEGSRLVSGGADRFARLVDTATARQTHALEGHTGHVLGVAWAPDGQTVATSGADGVVKLWNPVTGEKRKQGPGIGREVTAITFAGNSRRLVAASGENELRVLNENGERTLGLKGPTDFTYALAATADGRWLVAGGQDGVLRIWHPDQADPALQLKPAAPPATTASR
jgi:WD40 repeat protein